MKPHLVLCTFNLASLETIRIIWLKWRKNMNSKIIWSFTRALFGSGCPFISVITSSSAPRQKKPLKWEDFHIYSVLGMILRFWNTWYTTTQCGLCRHPRSWGRSNRRKYGNFRDYLVLSYEIKNTCSLYWEISCNFSFSTKMLRLDIISSHFTFDKLRYKSCGSVTEWHSWAMKSWPLHLHWPRLLFA